MNREEIIAKVNAAILAEFDVEEEDLKPEAKLADDLGLDSLDSIDLVVAIEKGFKVNGVKIAEQQARTLRTLNDIYTYIEGYLAKQAPGAGAP